MIGFPVREERYTKETAREHLGLEKNAVVTLVMGGSQGSKSLNTHVPDAYKELEATTTVYHSTGKQWLDEVKQHINNPSYILKDFVDAPLAWSAADLAITRAGFGTLSEAAYYGVPCIMIPLPTAAENHQLHNARAFAHQGAGWVLEEKHLSELADIWRKALNSDTRQRASSAVRQLSPEGSSRQIVKVLEHVLKFQTPKLREEPI